LASDGARKCIASYNEWSLCPVARERERERERARVRERERYIEPPMNKHEINGVVVAKGIRTGRVSRPGTEARK